MLMGMVTGGISSAGPTVFIRRMNRRNPGNNHGHRRSGRMEEEMSGNEPKNDEGSRDLRLLPHWSLEFKESLTRSRSHKTKTRRDVNVKLELFLPATPTQRTVRPTDFILRRDKRTRLKKTSHCSGRTSGGGGGGGGRRR